MSVPRRKIGVVRISNTETAFLLASCWKLHWYCRFCRNSQTSFRNAVAFRSVSLASSPARSWLSPTTGLTDFNIDLSIVDFSAKWHKPHKSARQDAIKTTRRFSRCRKTAYILFSPRVRSHYFVHYGGVSRNREEINPENGAFCRHEHPSGRDVF